jgi:hypothetical protein
MGLCKENSLHKLMGLITKRMFKRLGEKNSQVVNFQSQYYAPAKKVLSFFYLNKTHAIYLYTCMVLIFIMKLN